MSPRVQADHYAPQQADWPGGPGLPPGGGCNPSSFPWAANRGSWPTALRQSTLSAERQLWVGCTRWRVAASVQPTFNGRFSAVKSARRRSC